MSEHRKKFAVILAAGKGKRMKSEIPKVLHQLGGKALVDWVIDAVLPLELDGIVAVVGFKRDEVISHIREKYGDAIKFVHQPELLGTGDAVARALEILPPAGDVFVLCGDVPLIRTQTLRKLFEAHTAGGNSATILTARVPDPTGYGRIVRADDGSVLKIVEHKDATPGELAIDEINSGTYVFRIEDLAPALGKISNDNAQGEYYLTDVIGIFCKSGGRVGAVSVADYHEILGINSKEQLHQLEKFINSYQN